MMLEAYGIVSKGDIKMENILLIKGQSQYDAMRIYIDEVARAFRKLGYNTLVIDSMEEGCNEDILAARQMVFKFVFTFNAIGICEDFDWLSSKVINCTYLCDHPATHNDRIRHADANDIVIACDDRFRLYMDNHFPNIKKTAFVPLSGSYVEEEIPYEDRTMDVVFTGTYVNPVKKKEDILAAYTGTLRMFVERMLDTIIEHSEYTIEECLDEVLRFFGIREETTEREFHELVCTLMPVDAYARVYFRDKIIRILVNAGIQVHVYGNGWNNFELAYKENLIIEPGNAYIAQKAVANAKISLNMMPWFKSGFQERIASAMLSGTVALTDSSEYIDNIFEDGKDLVLYSLKELDRLPEIVFDLLKNPDKAKKIAEAGREKARAEHTWYHRAKEILDIVNEFQGNVQQDVQEEGKELVLEIDKRDIGKVLSDCISKLEYLLNWCRQLRKYAYYTDDDVAKIRNEAEKLVIKLKQYFNELDIDTYIFDESEMCFSTGDANYDGMVLENYLGNIFGQILSSEYNALWNQLEKEKEKNTLLDNQNNTFIVERVLRKYEMTENDRLKEDLCRIKSSNAVKTYNSAFIEKYIEADIRELCDLHYDSSCGLYYVNHLNKKMYYPNTLGIKDICCSYRFSLLEQDKKSPHRYLDDNFNINAGDIVIDAGVAEGNFSIEIIDKVKKLYLVECDPVWIEALNKTFEPYKDKVVIINKMLDSFDDDTHITIDTIADGEEIDFIKMDVEGYERNALEGARQTFSNSKNLKCAICSYHRKGDEEYIKQFLKEFDMNVSTTEGYMFYQDDLDSLIDGELRHGIVRGYKHF